MTPYALFIWDDECDVYIYELGDFDSADQAVEEAHGIMRSAHRDFVENDNPCWHVGPFRSLKRRSVSNSEN